LNATVNEACATQSNVAATPDPAGYFSGDVPKKRPNRPLFCFGLPAL
jgi:hypothetical protein